ncbi:MAG: 4Fe-4S dicluster domain-containing protein [Myxococcales bacterium]
MATVVVEGAGCRECRLCIEICPTKVFDQSAAGQVQVARGADCIGCSSCQYICPSRCIKVSDVAVQRPFFRIEENASLVRRLLQKEPVLSCLTEADLNEALRDVAVRLLALADSVTETMGRGQRAVGRKAGSLAALHLPEMYEGVGVQEVLDRMRRRFVGAFDFEATIEGSDVTMVFPHCAMHAVVEGAGGKVGDHVLCQLFHEYWAGLVGAFTHKNFAVQMLATGSSCTMQLTPRGG